MGRYSRRILGVCLGIMFLCQPVFAADLSQFFMTVHTLSGQFTQIVKDRHGHVVTRGGGQLWVARPGRFRWNYVKPYKEQIVGSGRSVWLYDPGLAQATRYTVNQALGRTPALLLAGDGHLHRLFHILNLGTYDGLHWLRLTPKGLGQGFRWIRVGYLGPHIHRIVLRDALGQTTYIRLFSVILNHPLPQSLFKFQPPPHTAIVSE